jgi:hypothetical protein
MVREYHSTEKKKREKEKERRAIKKEWCAPMGKSVDDEEEEPERADSPSSRELSLVAFLLM